MPIFDRLFELIASLGGFLFAAPEYLTVRLIISLIVLLTSVAGIIYWLVLELRHRFDRDEWQMMIEFWIEARQKPEQFKKEWRRIEDMASTNPVEAILEAEDLFQAVLDFYYTDRDPLVKRLEKIAPSLLPNRDRLLQVTIALELIRTHLANQQVVSLTAEEVRSILSAFEQGLLDLLVLTPEDCWVTPPTLPRIVS